MYQIIVIPSTSQLFLMYVHYPLMSKRNSLNETVPFRHTSIVSAKLSMRKGGGGEDDLK